MNGILAEIARSPQQISAGLDLLREQGLITICDGVVKGTLQDIRPSTLNQLRMACRVPVTTEINTERLS